MTTPVPGPPGPTAHHGALLLTIQGNRLVSGITTPTVLVDGYRVPATFGPNHYPLVPGRHRVDVHTWWMLRYGEATLEVDIAPGQAVPVFYAVPWHQFTTGSIGHVPQQRKGGRVVAVYFACVLALMLAVVCGLGAMLVALS